MEDQDAVALKWTGPVSVEVVPVLKPEIVEELLTQLGQGEKIKRLAAEYGVDRMTIRAWQARGRYQRWAYWPYRPQTKGKVKSSVKYMQRNALVASAFAREST